MALDVGVFYKHIMEDPDNSSLRRLKTWLRTTMTQQRLNSCAVCNIHRTLLDAVDVNAICNEFVLRNDFTQRLFGQSLEPT
mgnify:CR=1 FL=1